MEALQAMFLVLGLAALAASWVMLLIYSAREDFAWGLCTLLLPPVSYLYALARWQVARDPILFAILGWLLVALAFG